MPPKINGLLVPGNVNLYNRPKVKNPDGSISTVKSKSFSFDGVETLLPTVSDDGRLMDDYETINTYRKTGRHLGKFSSPDHADAYAQQLHNDYANGMYDLSAPAQPNVNMQPMGIMDALKGYMGK